MCISTPIVEKRSPDGLITACRGGLESGVVLRGMMCLAPPRRSIHCSSVDAASSTFPAAGSEKLKRLVWNVSPMGTAPSRSVAGGIGSARTLHAAGSITGIGISMSCTPEAGGGTAGRALATASLGPPASCSRSTAFPNRVIPMTATATIPSATAPTAAQAISHLRFDGFLLPRWSGPDLGRAGAAAVDAGRSTGGTGRLARATGLASGRAVGTSGRCARQVSHKS